MSLVDVVRAEFLRGRNLEYVRAAQGAGIALLPVRMFAHELQQGRLVRPFETEIHTGQYWLTRLKSRPVTGAMQAFSDWLVQAAPMGRLP